MHDDAAGDEDGDSGPESSAADPEWEQQHSWLALPRDLPVQGVKVDLVPDTDPRVPLRGQRGIWAAQNLPEGFLIGERGRGSDLVCELVSK
jgi:hypothetical protein